ncbi:hypothetical protein EYR41_009723 [Orbilia oligospora]|uniref:Uncharacterized protein n=1 Tax=Orbilia oligospora TaxID=2813651 RepID=A0A7C8KFR7_ORBOL|nr:hypothetical protein TWF751_009053 [Orbilia oligospora]TGJ65777.1 hypothetical protein EYR41_009723 [Orbilia oligospora]
MSNLTPTQTITTTTPSGASTIHSSSPITFVPLNPPYNTLLAGNVFTTHTFPTVLSDEDDIKRHEAYVPKGIGVKKGVVAVMNKFLPGAECPAHRTETIDFGVVVEGELEVLLDGGEKKRFGRGDVVVQRGTYHGWRNPSMENETLVFFVAVAAEAVVVGEEVLGEDLKNLGM